MARKRKKQSMARRLGVWALFFVAALLLLSMLLTLPLRWFDPPTSAFMLQDDSGRIPVLYQWQDWNQLGNAAALAVIAAEDQRFDRHFGIDFASIRDSLDNAATRGQARGASTITQQVAKNLYLWPGRNLVRKGLEAWLALNLELYLPKKRILEIYLNIIELGPGIYGIPAACRYFYGKPAAALTDYDAALLAAVLPNPHRLQVDHPSVYLRERQAWILQQMRRLRREHWLLHIDPIQAKN